MRALPRPLRRASSGFQRLSQFDDNNIFASTDVVMAAVKLEAPPQLGRLSLVTADSLATQLPHTLSEASLLLREDDSLLRQTFFEVVYHHHPHLADKIDEIYKLSLAWCNTESDKDFQALEKILSGLNPDELILVTLLLSFVYVALMLASAPSRVWPRAWICDSSCRPCFVALINICCSLCSARSSLSRQSTWVDLQLDALWQVSSCFSQLLNLHNLSEEISSAQLERAVRIGEVRH